MVGALHFVSSSVVVERPQSYIHVNLTGNVAFDFGSSLPHLLHLRIPFGTDFNYSLLTAEREDKGNRLSSDFPPASQPSPGN